MVHWSNFLCSRRFLGIFVESCFFVILVAGERAPGTRFCPQHRSAEDTGREARQVVSRVRAKTGRSENGGTSDPRLSAIARRRKRRRKRMTRVTRIGRSAPVIGTFVGQWR